MKRMTQKSISTFFVLFCCYFALSGQSDLPTDTVFIQTKFRPELATSHRIDINPDSPKGNDGSQRPLYNDYEVAERLISMEYEPISPKPLAVRAARREQLRHAWLKLGLGNRWTTIGDLSLATGRSNDYNLGLHVHHLSAHPKNDFDFLRTGGKVFGSYFGETREVGAHVGFQRGNYWLYGTPDSLEVENAKQAINTLDFGVLLRNTEENISDLIYQAGVNYEYTWNQTINDEHNFIVKGMVNKGVDRFQLGADFLFDYTAYTDTSNRDNLLVQLTPKATIQGNGGRLIAGMSMIIDSTQVYPFPHLLGELFLSEQTLIAYAGWQMEGVKNNYTKFARENPFVSVFLNFKNSRIEKRFLGLKGFAGDRIEFQLQAAQNFTHNQPLYINDTLKQERFVVLYEGKLKHYDIQTEIGYSLNKFDRLWIGANYLIYKPEDHEYAWHLPTFKLNMGLDYQLNEKMAVGGELFTYAGRKARALDKTAIDLKTIFDLNFNFNYFISENASLFFDLNNVTSAKQQRFYSYPTYGITALGGFKLIF